jgi:hypothetical protein
MAPKYVVAFHIHRLDWLLSAAMTVRERGEKMAPYVAEAKGDGAGDTEPARPQVPG